MTNSYYCRLKIVSSCLQYYIASTGRCRTSLIRIVLHWGIARLKSGGFCENQPPNKIGFVPSCCILLLLLLLRVVLFVVPILFGTSTTVTLPFLIFRSEDFNNGSFKTIPIRTRRYALCVTATTSETPAAFASWTSVTSASDARVRTFFYFEIG